MAVVAAVVVLALVLVGIFGAGGPGETSSGDAPVQTAPAEPTTFEEWIQVNAPDFPNDLRNSFLGITGIRDVSVEVVRNQITVRCFYALDSGDVGYWGEVIGDAINEEFNKDKMREMRAKFTKMVFQLEEKTGIEPIKMHLEECYRDGSVMRSYDFTSSI